MFPLRKVLKWFGISAGGLAIALVIAYGIIYYRSEKIVHRDFSEIPKPRAVYVKTDSLTIAQGRHMARALTMCTECHGENLGGKLIADMGPVGKLAGPNLTSGSGGILTKEYTISDFDRAVRHGVKANGMGVNIMPSYHYCYLSDEDLAAIYAYVRTMPPVDNAQGGLEVGPIGRFLFVKGLFPPPVTESINHNAKRPAKPAAGVTAEYGEYLAHISCVGCHGLNLSGGPIDGGDPSWPPAANLSSVVRGHYTEEQFLSLLKTGVRPGGKKVATKAMPIQWTQELTDDEMRALYLYIQSVPEQPLGSFSWRTKNVAP